MRVSILAAAVATGLAGCGGQAAGCLGGDDGKCVPPAACPARAAAAGACSAPPGSLRIGRLAAGDWTTAERPAGGKVAGARDDFVLENDRLRVVIAAPDHGQGLAPAGGSIIDLSLRGADGGDQINGLVHATGLLPRDAVRYRTAEIIDRSPDFVALVVRGHLDGNPKVPVVTRYELRPCEIGVRVRSELYNGSREVNTFYLADGFFWGDGGLLPFVPLRGQGFRHPPFDLLELAQAWRIWPFLAARPQADPQVAYAMVPCGRAGAASAGFNDPTLSAGGIGLVPTLPQDALAYDRFLLVAPGPGLAAAASAALEARADFHGEPRPGRVDGRVVTGAEKAPLDGRTGRAASLLFYEPAATAGDPDDVTARRPWNEAVPDPEGRFEVALPPGRAFRVQPHAFGRPAGPAVAFTTPAPGGRLSLGDVPLDRPARLSVTIEDERRQPAPYAELVVVPVEAPPPGAGPSLYGMFPGCAPMLGPPHGGSPACNRALVVDGEIDLLVPAGRYVVYATRGPFASLGRAEVALDSGDLADLTLRSARLPMLGPGVLSGDFHVHGGASFDSSLPAADRVVSFLAAGVDVIAATDHDVVTTYAEELDALGARDRLAVMPGAELTPNILWFKSPGDAVPKVVGHFNFWPLRHDRALPRNGAPFDEQLEPGAIMDAVERLWADPAAAVRQMNHPWTAAKLGRDQGFLRMLEYDPRTPVTAGRSFAADVLLRRPAGGRRNLDFDAQEVMTGANRRDWIRARALWFSFLSQGILRAGTANSDTHTFAIEQAGYPRTLVLGSHAVPRFDPVAFNADLRAGRLVGTNGPVLDVRLVPAGAAAPAAGARPSLEAVAAGRDATLVVDVGVAPWIPVTEVRFVVNGKVVRTTPVPLGEILDVGGVDRHHELRLPLGELLDGVPGDAWLVVEAGLPLPAAADLDGDGLVETLDNDGDGKIDRKDIPADDEDDDDRRFPNPGRPPAIDPRFHLEAIAPGTWPYAFTNPFILDLDGAGWKAPGL